MATPGYQEETPAAARERAAVEKSLGGGFSCRFVHEVRVVDSSGKKVPHSLALVADAQKKKEYALLLYKGKRLRTKGLICIPIFKDFRYFVKDSSNFSLGSPSLGMEFIVEAMTPSLLNAIISNLSKVYQISSMEGYHRGGPSHQWTKRFLDSSQTSTATLPQQQQQSPVTTTQSLIDAPAVPASFSNSAHSSSPSVQSSPSPSSPSSAMGSSPETDLISLSPKKSGISESFIKRNSVSSPQGSSTNASSTSTPPSSSSSSSDNKVVGGSLMFEDIKQEWIMKQMKSRTKDFTEKVQYRFLCGTYNVATEEAAPDLAPWLIDSCDESILTNEADCPDVYACAFQEVDMSVEAVLLSVTNKGKPWEDAVVQTLLRLPCKYTLVGSKQLAGMFICVFIKSSLRKEISGISTAEVGCGLVGKMGNKGGVAVRFQMHDSSVVFIGAHLASGQGLSERRNQDYGEILRRMVFNQGLTIEDHDFIFFLGDFNYRINLTSEETKRLIAEKNYDALLRCDQLKYEQKKENVFVGFEEPPIRFAPTYKYDYRSTVFDTSEKKRIPAYCDRILMAGDPQSVALFYRRAEIIWSDHRPVSALFRIPLRRIIESKKHAAYTQIVRELDRMENECMPDARVSQHNFVFENVRYLVRESQSFILENTGQVLVQWRFIPKLNDVDVCKSWLRITPLMGILTPGESTKIEFSIFVDNRTVSLLNAGSDMLEDILILHLENGKDHFCALQGKYVRSAFGCKLSDLVACPGPVRSLDVFPPTNPLSPPLSVPRELWRIIDYIYSSDEMNSDRLFRMRGADGEVSLIREALDTGNEFPVSPQQRFSVHSMTAVLIEFLDALPDPLVSNPFAMKLMEHVASYQQCKVDLARDATFSTVHRNSFVYVVYFLREVINRNTGNRNDLLQSVVVIFSAVMFRLGPLVGGRVSGTKDPAMAKRQASILQNFLTDRNDFI